MKMFDKWAPARSLGMLTLAGLVMSVAPVHAQGAGPGGAPADLSGFWGMRADSKKVTPAPLVPGFNRKQPKFNEIVLMASRWCHPLGTPFIMGDSAPLDMVQGAKEMIIAAEVQSSARHIYLDGRAHPPADEFDNTTNGHSVGRWEGDVLVVDTVGFSEQGNLGIPGGGLRGPKSHLVERYQLRNGGAELNVQFTWEDPEVFTKPHMYEFTYHRGQDGEYAREYFCDASDPSRGESVKPEE